MKTLLLISLFGIVVASDYVDDNIFNIGNGRKTEEDHFHDNVLGDTGGRKIKDVTEDSSFWNTLAQEDLKEQLKKHPIVKQAKNIVLFLADGHSVTSFTAARILKGQRTPNGKGEREIMEYEKFPDSCLIKTYSADYQVTDSGAAATGYLSGVKGNQETIGVDVNVQLNDCDAQNQQQFWTHSIIQDFINANKSTGVVTTSRVTHATPAASYAHMANREWENDADMTELGADPNKCDDAAEQLILGETGSQIKVIMGGGRQKFVPDGKQYPGKECDGRREDEKDLIEEWIKIHNEKGNSKYISNRQQLLDSDTENADYLLGLFSCSHMAFHVDREESDPTLEEMTIEAIKVLQKDNNGFFLLVEGGLIDEAHHFNKYRIAMDEALEFEKAVTAAVNMVDEDTLIIVTADHSHSLTFNGYTDRENDIIGVGVKSDVDHKPFMTLMYTIGPGYTGYDSDGERHDPSKDDWQNPHYAGPAAVPDKSANHAGDDVLLYAKGPHSHLFSGIHENTYIAHALRYAACVGDGLKFCDN